MLKEFTHINTLKHTHTQTLGWVGGGAGNTNVPIPTMEKKSLMNIYDARDAGPVGLSAWGN